MNTKAIMRVKVFILILMKISFANCKMEGNIVGGEIVKSIQEFPYVASLIMGSENGAFVCGSTILNQIILLTAAHCVDDAISGAAFTGDVYKLKGSRHGIYSYKQHENYVANGVKNDIALCKLRQPLQLGSTVQRVMILRNPPQTEIAEVAGWGAVEEDRYTATDMLKCTGQRIWTYEECKTVLENSLPVGTICGGEKQSSTNIASKGDSGSGLVINKNTIIGIVSFKNIRVSRSLVVYTDTAYFYDWIRNRAQKLTRRCIPSI